LLTLYKGKKIKEITNRLKQNVTYLGYGRYTSRQWLVYPWSVQHK